MKLTEFRNEFVGLSQAFSTAARKAELSSSTLKALVMLYTRPDPPWTLSALADLVNRDRATVRGQLKELSDGWIARQGDFIILTEDGRVDFLKVMRSFCDDLTDPYKAVLFEYFRDEPEKEPAICDLARIWDDMAASTGHNRTYLGVFIAIYRADRKRGISTVDTAKSAVSSYQGTHRVLIELQKNGYVGKNSRKWFLTLKGDAKAVTIILSGIKCLSPKDLKRIIKLTVFARKN